MFNGGKKSDIIRVGFKTAAKAKTLVALESCVYLKKTQALENNVGKRSNFSYPAVFEIVAFF